MQSSEGTVGAATPDGGIVEAPPEPSAVPAAAGGSHGAGAGDIHLPPPSMWPITTALGVSFAGLGLVTTPVVSIIGLVVLFFGLLAWIQELRHEHH